MAYPLRPALCAWKSSLLLGLLVCTATAGCGGAQPADAAANGAPSQGPQDKKAEGPPALIRVDEVLQREIHPRIVVVGTVTPLWTSVVASGAEGIVERFRVEAGDFVEKDDVLSVLRMVTTDLEIAEANAVLLQREQEYLELQNGSRPEDVAEAKAKMQAAEVVMNNTAKKLRRANDLFAQKAIGQDELDDAEERARAGEQMYLAAKAAYDRIVAGPRDEQVEQARARYEAQKAQVAFLEAEKDKRTTAAPFDGYVTKVQTFVGMWLSKGDPVVTLAMLDKVDVVANVDQRDLRHIRVGEQAEVQVAGAGQQPWPGDIVQIVSRSEWQTGSRSFPVEVRVDNRTQEVNGKPQPVLREGMMAEVTFTGSPIETLVVPKNALVRGTRGVTIFLFEATGSDSQTGTVRPVSVEPGLSEGDLIKVPGVALAAGMQVVTEGAERLRPFQSAQIVVDK